MLKIALLSLLALLVVFVVVAALQPSQLRVTRSATFTASPEEVFALVNNLHKWETWSPWAKKDPAMKMTYAGPDAGVGAVSAWSGNNEVGEGRSTILESRPNELVRIQLDFLKPFKATNTAEFTFKTEGNQTVVTWSMFGERNFFFKAAGLFMDCDKMIGGDFEQGFANMKSVTQAPVPVGT